MREHRTGNECCLMLKAVNQLVDIGFGIKAQTVHTSIQFDMYRPSGDTFLAGCTNQGIHQTERIHLWLKIIVEEGFERCHLRVHHHDIGSNAGFAQGHALIGYSHSQIIYAVVLQGLGYFDGTGSIGIGLDHAHHFRVGFQERTEMVQVIDHSLEIHLKNGFMNFLLQQFGDALKTEPACTFQQHQFVGKLTEHCTIHKLFNIMEEMAFGNINQSCLRGYLITDTNEFGHPTVFTHVGHLLIERSQRLATLIDIAENEGDGRWV